MGIKLKLLLYVVRIGTRSSNFDLKLTALFILFSGLY